MSKIGKKIIPIPQGVQVVPEPSNVVKIKGPKGEETVLLHRKVSVEIKDGTLSVAVANPQERRHKALWGTSRALLQNAVIGVTEGFSKKLEIVGVGYKAQVTPEKLTLNVGFSHPVELAIPRGLSVILEKNTLTVSGISKQAVGEFSAKIRSVRKPEPYKGKGIKYSNEIIRRKAGKVIKAVGG